MGRLRILFLILLLAGCCARPSVGAPEIVTRMDVISIEDGKTRQFTYTDPAKIQLLLNYLRTAEPAASDPITPETFRTDAYEIRLTLLGGSQRVYHQIYDRYLQKGDGPWRHIDSRLGSRLPELLHSLPPDAL